MHQQLESSVMSARDGSVVSFVKRKLRELKVTNDYGFDYSS